MTATLVRVLCRPATARGFALAGLAADPVVEGLDPTPAIEEALARPGTGVLLIEEPIYDGLGGELRTRLDRSTLPVVVPFPGPTFEAGRPAEERVVDMLRRAIGYRVKLG